MKASTSGSRQACPVALLVGKDYEGRGRLWGANGEGGLRDDGRQANLPIGRAELGHGLGLEELFALLCCPASPAFGLFAPRAVGGDAGAGVHLAVELGEEDEGEAC